MDSRPAKGPPGNGKTHLAGAVVRAVFEAGGFAVFANVPRLMVRFERTYRPGAKEHETDLLRALIECDLLVLDDIGAEKWTAKREERLYLIVNSRLDDFRPLVCTTNCPDLEILGEHTGDRVLDRLVGDCLLVENKAPSYRVELARRRLKGGAA